MKSFVLSEVVFKDFRPEFRKTDQQKRQIKMLSFGYKLLKPQGTSPLVSSEGEKKQRKHNMWSRNREEAQLLHEALLELPVKCSVQPMKCF